MFIPPVCFSCGGSVGEYGDICHKILAARTKKRLKEAATVPPKAAGNLTLQADNSDLFDALGIKQRCCRWVITSTMLLEDYY